MLSYKSISRARILAGNIKTTETHNRIFRRCVNVVSQVRHTLAVGIFDSISTTTTHNRILEANLYNCAACQKRFVMPLPTLYKPMIEVQMPLY